MRDARPRLVLRVSERLEGRSETPGLAEVRVTDAGLRWRLRSLRERRTERVRLDLPEGAGFVARLFREDDTDEATLVRPVVDDVVFLLDSEPASVSGLLARLLLGEEAREFRDREDAELELLLRARFREVDEDGFSARRRFE